MGSAGSSDATSQVSSGSRKPSRCVALSVASRRPRIGGVAPNWDDVKRAVPMALVSPTGLWADTFLPLIQWSLRGFIHDSPF